MRLVQITGKKKLNMAEGSYEPATRLLFGIISRGH